MYAPIQLVRRYPISAFAVLACLFGWMIYGLAAVGVPTDTDNMPLGPADRGPRRHVVPGS